MPENTPTTTQQENKCNNCGHTTCLFTEKTESLFTKSAGSRKPRRNT